MTKEEFINKWKWHDEDERPMMFDLDEVIKFNTYIPSMDIGAPPTVTSTVTWTYLPTVDPNMEGLGHQWVFPPADVFETAYCVCANCGVTSEEMESEWDCKNPIGGENE